MGESIRGLGEKQIKMIFYRYRLKLSYSEIGDMLGTSKQNVHSTLKRINRNYTECKEIVELVELASNPFVEVTKGSNVMDVSDRVLEVADSEGIKLRGNKSEIITWIKWHFNMDDLIIKEEGGIVIKNDGSLMKVSDIILKKIKALLNQYGQQK
ncbi:hypothetical protein EYM_00745 [Ignicoccus islandicus DSM 13165]|uniref:DNA binding protein Tfx C-terminal domain-containing protein n=1 Tax=Ignicoccus islandicus DSM 13165 TaxID=940295 RepID=A0A0U3DXA6_9CREN|nr:hypothetical protein [Ignicoccus islandicus]ALU12138.1 hypothetical protein EYM_00745 [Ignicoccus islandicus DSM 13165]